MPAFLTGFSSALAGVLLTVWLYVCSFPMAFLESGYPSWVAKLTMLRDCQLARIAMFGDLRLEAGVMPALLPVEATNFGLAAGTAVELRSAITRALACSPPPGEVLLSLAPLHFGPLYRFFGSTICGTASFRLPSCWRRKASRARLEIRNPSPGHEPRTG